MIFFIEPLSTNGIIIYLIFKLPHALTVSKKSLIYFSFLSLKMVFA